MSKFVKGKICVVSPVYPDPDLVGKKVIMLEEIRRPNTLARVAVAIINDDGSRGKTFPIMHQELRDI